MRQSDATNGEQETITHVRTATFSTLQHRRLLRGLRPVNGSKRLLNLLHLGGRWLHRRLLHGLRQLRQVGGAILRERNDHDLRFRRPTRPHQHRHRLHLRRLLRLHSRASPLHRQVITVVTNVSVFKVVIGDFFTRTAYYFGFDEISFCYRNLHLAVGFEKWYLHRRRRVILRGLLSNLLYS